MACDSEGDISHGIFFTAIMRARKALKIFCAAENRKRVSRPLDRKRSGRDIELLKVRRGLKRVA